ncbi:uncharacterized protein LOC124461563 [Drosophila willistoni]|uniref:uncharacterized protein LOC124461563 n=1 Tax=Drosophila willistoni TaxID=7260 RepID=UPI001F082373|nr:uncharacterized protein LOC124461563 [Drosophila willistoni]
MVPLRKATSVALEKAFRERIWARFGNPRTLVSDNGTQFTSKLFKNFCRTSGIILQHTPQYLENGQNTWDQWLSEITLAINSSVNDTTGFSPAYIILGREPRMPGALYDQVTDVGDNEPPSPDERIRRMEDIFKLVHKNQLNATESKEILRPETTNVVRLQEAQGRERRTAGLADLKAFNSDDIEPSELGLSEDIGLGIPRTHGPHEATD